jgi:hypothetical protein
MRLASVTGDRPVSLSLAIVAFYIYPSNSLLALLDVCNMYAVWLTVVLATLLGGVPWLLVVLAPIGIRAAGRLLGWYLLRKTDGRRHQILERVEDEQKALDTHSNISGGSDDEWQKVESCAVGTATNGEEANKEWDGIVGFLHPFW